MMWYLYFAIAAVCGPTKDYAVHVDQMFGLLCLVSFPGVVRAVAILPGLQVFLFGTESGCDSTSTSGLIAFTMPVCIARLMLVRHAALGLLGPIRTRDYATFFLISAVDVILGLMGDSLFCCFDALLLEQKPGQPWVPTHPWIENLLTG